MHFDNCYIFAYHIRCSQRAASLPNAFPRPVSDLPLHRAVESRDALHRRGPGVDVLKLLEPVYCSLGVLRSVETMEVEGFSSNTRTWQTVTLRDVVILDCKKTG
jgi:hypothetical protein